MAEQFDRVAIGVLAPDIQDTLNVSDTTLIGIASFGGIALVLGAVPLAWLADRMSRARIVWVASLGWAVATVFNGLVVNPFQMFCARVAVGFGQSYSLPVFASLLADKYPIQGRSRVFGVVLRGPARWYVDRPVRRRRHRRGGRRARGLALGLRRASPSRLRCSGCVSAVVLREPPRGHFEQELVLGGQLDRPDTGKELPVSISAAYQRLKKIQTFYYICVGIGVLGFALVAVPVQLGLLLKDSYGYGRVHPGVDHLAHRHRLARLDPRRRLALRPAVPQEPGALSCASPACSIFAYGVFMMLATRMHAPVAAHRLRSASPTRARAPRSSASGPSSARWRRTGCGRRRSRSCPCSSS